MVSETKKWIGENQLAMNYHGKWFVLAKNLSINSKLS